MFAHKNFMRFLSRINVFAHFTYRQWGADTLTFCWQGTDWDNFSSGQLDSSYQNHKYSWLPGSTTLPLGYQNGVCIRPCSRKDLLKGDHSNHVSR